ncbi:RNA-directed DNA polymerase [bacterium]|nr:RNA-directed DNA polymerase [bacterium]
MSMPQSHFKETKKLALQLDPNDIAKWLLEQGFYPEQYVLPPCFDTSGFALQSNPYFPILTRQGKSILKADLSELLVISLPKTMLTQRDFAIIDPRHYHDMVLHVIDDWNSVLDHLFHDDQEFYSYSFPIPLSRDSPGSIGSMRAGRMIYEFLEMAESDLVAEAHRFKFLVRTDIKNFYGSVYTHSIPWALQGKPNARVDRYNIDSLGKKLDKLTQQCNDGCTNGLAIGPAISDLISEMLLAAVDLECSRQLNQKDIRFVGVRFKDDYRILCDTEDDAKRITTYLQKCMQTYNLTLSEGKSDCIKLPEGLFRPWKSHYQKLSLKRKLYISYRAFELVLQSVLRIDEQLPGTGIIDTFLSELTSKKYNLKLDLAEKDRRKAFSLLLILRERRAKSFPVILAIIEALLDKYNDDAGLRKYVESSLVIMYKNGVDRLIENEYEILWLAYFRKMVLHHELDPIPGCSSPLINSILSSSRKYFEGFTDESLFAMPPFPVERNHLLQHLEIFRRQKAGEIDEDKEQEEQV